MRYLFSKLASPVLIPTILLFCSIALFAEPAPKEAFPLVLYGVPNVDEDIVRAKELGFNHIYRSGNGFAGDPADPERMADIQSYLDRAASHGMKVAFCLDGPRRTAKREVGFEQMQSIIRRFKKHPAIGFWYLYDEPNLPSPKTKRAMLAARYQEEGGNAGEAVVKEVTRPVAQLLPFYEMVKQESPDIPVILMMAITEDGWWADAWKGFYPAYDIVSFDTYPVYAAPFPESNLGRVTKWMESYRKGTDKPVMPCLQVFNWNSLSGRVERAKLAGRTDYKDWRYPNLQELRYWNFSSLLQGAPGLIYYTYGGPDMQRRPPASWLEGVLKPTTHELKRFTELTKNAPLTELSGLDDSLILAGLWKTQEGTFVAIANGNATSERLVSERILKELNRGDREAWEFTRAGGVEQKDGEVVGVNMQPWEVQVWRMR